ncbi:MAG: hypothetical protein NVSMB27_35550 [Ktedonobacteraceae bacterium]
MTTKKRMVQATTWSLHKGILALGIALYLLYATTVLAFANTVYINDAAHVLGDQSQVRSAAAGLPDPVSIYTTSTFKGPTTQFDQQTRNHITNPNMIVIAIDTAYYHLAIVGGSNVALSNSQYQDAVQSFKSNYKGSGYSGATVAALSTLRQDLGAAPVAPGNGNNNGNVPASNGGIFSLGFLPLCCIGLLILLIVGALFGARRRMFGRRQMGGAIPYQQPYNQGYPPNYGGPGYYNQGQGMNPLAAGGLGAAAGGLVGYELGKEQGEDQARDQGWNQGQQGQGGDFGGGASGDFGGGSGGDFGGGGGGDFGGGGNF